MTDVDPRQLAGARIIRSFEGPFAPDSLLGSIRAGRAAGVGLYRALNVETPVRLAELTASLQAARPAGSPSLLIGLDQEGGQLQAFGDGATAWPGNLALAATADATLARRAGEAVGRELAAVGVNVAWAPVCDLLSDGSVVMGTRTFGDDPEVAGRMATEMIEGLQASGIAATIKHFPGHGSAAADSHVELPIVDAELDSLRRRELVPFAAAIRARPRLAMVAHVAVPGITGDASLPATFAPAVVGLLRGDLGFGGVVISDALNMGALGPLEDAAVHVVRAAAAGLDLCLMLHTPDVEERSTDVLAEAITDGRVDRRAAEASAERVGTLRRWLDRRASDRATLDEVGAPEHRALAREIAERSVTLVGDRHGLLPLRASVDRPLLVVVPRPVDLTPADTSSYLRVGLADELRVRGLRADELVLPLDPTTADVAAIVHRAAGRTVVIGTVDATVHRGQAAVVDALIALDVPVVAVALRTPFDVAAYARVGAYACTYGIQPPSIEALADALVGRIPFRGRLPVTLAVPAAAA